MRTARFAFFLALGFFLYLESPARADMVIFKDGFVLSGKIREQGGVESDPLSGQTIWMPRGFFALDGYARRIFFSPSQVQDVNSDDPLREGENIRLEKRFTRYNSLPMYPLTHIYGPTPFDAKWERIFKIEAPHGRANIQQRLAVLTPQFARADALKYFWSSYYLTPELGPDAVRNLLADHPELQLKGDKEDVDKRMRIFRFLAQAGFYDKAESELKTVAKEFPAEKNKTSEGEEYLKKLRTLQVYEGIEKAVQAGRHQWAQKAIQEFPASGLDDKLLANIRIKKSFYETQKEKLDQARSLLQELLPQVDPVRKPLFKEATAAILEELSIDNLDRLEPFITQPRAPKNGKTPIKTGNDKVAPKNQEKAAPKQGENEASQLLAMAVTGWLMGKGSAEPRSEIAQKYWLARKLVLDYQNTPDAVERNQMMRSYDARPNDVLAIDEISQLIQYLPPPKPEKDLSFAPVQYLTPPTRLHNKGIEYLVQLPPEYHHSRPYPVLIALHLGREQPKVILDRLRYQAALNGYILVAPEWALPLEDLYKYTPDEHETVVEVLQELRRHFQVDSDRVFLFGFGQGGNMAFDVGFAHPDLFAGVVLMSATPLRFPGKCWHNCQYLPLYLVDGDMTGDNPKKNKPLLEKWIPRGYPVIFVEYKGRGIEWYEQELPTIFDWMNKKRDLKKRAKGFPDLGRAGNGGPFGDEFQTMRPTDNRFYWITLDSISDRNLNDAENWNNLKSPATVQGTIFEGTQIALNIRGIRKITVWLGQNMVDFSKPITIRINGGVQRNNVRITPSLTVLLEDLYQRSDRQRLFWAKMDFDGL